MLGVVGGVTSDKSEDWAFGDVAAVVATVTIDEVTDDAGESAALLFAAWVPDCTEGKSSVGLVAERSFLERTLGEGRERRRRDASGIPPARIFN